MFSSSIDTLSPRRRALSRVALSSAGLAIASAAIEWFAVVMAAITSGCVYHLAVYRDFGPVENYLAVGVLAGLVYGITFIARDDYSIDTLLERRRTTSKLFLVWNLAFVALALIGFLTKSTQMFSRGWLVLFYVWGFAVTIITNELLTRGLKQLLVRGWIRHRRLMIVATDRDLSKFEREIVNETSAFQVVARVALPSMAQRAEEIDLALDAAIRNARLLSIDDVLISHSILRPDFIERTVEAFATLPVAVHLGASNLVARFKDARVARFGHTPALSLTRAPLGPFEASTKRIFDIFAALLALLLLSPLFAVVALLIKLDSPGPVFFRQRRRGYNTEEFRIWKFRTMSTMDDGDVVRQATQNDTRVTTLGRFLRRTSIDELPQLMNVLSGQMSLVGPRPHAVAHDRFFEKRIADYPRRLNVKPGITGWAQVNGFRGATETDDAMRLRVEHDVYYIENCSIGFDLYILLLTVISPKVSRNAH